MSDLKLTASETADLARSASMLAVERAEYRIAYTKLRAAVERVVAAFSAHGESRGIGSDIRTRQECEAAMVALKVELDTDPTP